jgi:hypothetical protein
MKPTTVVLILIGALAALLWEAWLDYLDRIRDTK